MDPFTIALATFGVQKLRGKSTRTALKDAFTMGAGSYGLSAFAPSFAGQLGISAGAAPFSTLTGIGAGTAGTATGTGLTTGQATALDGITNYGAAGSQSALASKAAADAAAKEMAAKGLYTATPGVANVPSTGGGIMNTLSSGAGKVGDWWNKLDTGSKIGVGVTGATLAGSLMEDEEEPIQGYSEEDYKKAYEKQKAGLAGLTDKAEATKVETSPYDYVGDDSLYAFNTGGIVNALPKFNSGGINYLPSKHSHDEHDVHNYVRAAGYVEDGTGNGDKDEDTILAQLADGEFVSRADAILGAGIMEGASPKDMKEMRKKGAAFFYGQQAKFKRVFDLLNASRKDN